MVAAPAAASARDISPDLAWPAAARNAPRPQEYAAGSGRPASRSVLASVCRQSNLGAGRAQSRRQNHAPTGMPSGPGQCGNSARPNDADPVDVLQSLARLVGAMLHNEPLLERAYHRMQRLQLRCQYDQARTGINGQTSILFVCNDCQQLLEPFAALRGRNPELS